MLNIFVQLSGKQDIWKGERENRMKMMGMREAGMKGKCEDTGREGKALGKRFHLKVKWKQAILNENSPT